jgi:UMF1 family MFS transporter
MYDWANSAFVLVIITAVFPVYFQQVVAAGLDKDAATVQFGWSTTIALTLVAILSPILGALADFLGVRKRMLAVSIALGVIATACMYFISHGNLMLALVLFALGNVGISLSFVFYDSLLPHIASVEEMDRVSSAGYAIGYLGSALLLMLNLWWIQEPGTFGIANAETATRLSFLSVAVWWGVFSIPIFRRVAEPARLVDAGNADATHTVRGTFRALLTTLTELRRTYRQAAIALLAMFVYNDGIGTIIRMAAIYAATIGVPQQHVIIAILLVQLIGIPFSFLFGSLAGRIGTKTAIMMGLVVYSAISVVAYRMTSTAEFYVLAILVATVQGGTQALSRSLYASMIPKHKASEFFGFYSVFDKVSGIFGPMVFSLMIVIAGSTRAAILSVIAFFVIGAIILSLVNVAEGQRQAREAEARFLSPQGS